MRSGQKILDNISLELFEHEIVSLIGLNGSGKTSLLRLIIGMYKPEQGAVELFTKKIGYVPQRLDFDRSMPLSVADLLSIYSNQSLKLINKTLKDVQAEHLAENKIGILSGGELQRVLIANALLQKPELLLLDEATSGIDLAGEKSFYELIEEIYLKYGMAIVIVSHDIHTVFSKSSRVYCLDGKICCHGSPEDISKHPEFTKLFGRYVAPYQHVHK